VENSSAHIQMIDIPAIFSNHRDEILTSGEFPDRGTSFSGIRLFIAIDYSPCFVPSSAVRMVFRLVDPFGAIGLTCNCLAPRELTMMNVLLTRNDVHPSFIAHFQCS